VPDRTCLRDEDQHPAENLVDPDERFDRPARHQHSTGRWELRVNVVMPKIKTDILSESAKCSAA
jgi:hypothetical protein